MNKKEKLILAAGMGTGIAISALAIAVQFNVICPRVPYSARAGIIEVISYLANKPLPGCSKEFVDLWF